MDDLHTQHGATRHAQHGSACSARCSMSAQHAADEDVGRPLLEPDHPTFELREGDERVQPRLHVEDVASHPELEGIHGPPRWPHRCVELYSDVAVPLDTSSRVLVNRPERSPAESLHLVLKRGRPSFTANCVRLGSCAIPTRGFSHDTYSRINRPIPWRIFVVKTRIFPKTVRYYFSN